MSSPLAKSYPASPLQEGMLFQRLCERHPGVDLVQVSCAMAEPVDVSRFQHAWAATIERHDALRTSLDFGGAENATQRVHREAAMPFTSQDWRRSSAPNVEKRWLRFLRADRLAGFDLECPPLMRIFLVRTSRWQWRFCWTFHHINLDSRALHLVLDEVFARFEGSEPRFTRLTDAPPQHGDYIAWQQRQQWAQAESFWRNELGGFTRPNALALAKMPADLAPNEEAVGEHLVYLSRELTARLRELAAGAGATLNNVLQAAWATLIGRYNNEHDVVIGATRACRRSNTGHADTTVGLFVNTLPLRVRFRDEWTVADCLRELRARWLAMRDFENTPLLHVQGWSDVARGERLFHTILNFQDPSWDNELAARGGRWDKRRFGIRGQTGYPITLDVYGGEQLGIKIMFDVRRFDETAAGCMMRHLCVLLENMSHNPQDRLSRVSMLSDDERRDVTSIWNQSSTAFPRDRRIHEIFHERVAQTPDAIALTFDGVSITYRELDRQSDQIALRLRQHGTRRGDKIAVCMERGADLIASLLAVLKTGSAYVPLDPNDPLPHMLRVLKDTDTLVMLTKREYRERLAETPPCLIVVDSGLEGTEPCTGAVSETAGSADDLAYVIFTSGSTGHPKGVCVSHRAVVRLVRNTHYAQFGPDQTLLQFAPVSFDASTFEIWGALLHGARLAIMKPGLPGLEDLAQFIRDARVSMMFATTGLFVQLIAQHARCLRGVRQLLTGGEVMPASAVASALRALKKTRLIHCYGPTENTTFTTTHDLSAAGLDRTSVPIGRPIANTTVLVLDADRQPQPVGVPGELWTGGDGLAQGYLNDPALTAEKFVQHRFDANPAARLYRTGDLVRWLPDGTLDFIGRLDNQAKVRGYRVEPREVEMAIMNHPAVLCAVVCARDDGDGAKALHGWYQVNHGHAVEPSELLVWLRAQLPAFMVPSTLQDVAGWPLTPNGKIDKPVLTLAEPRRQTPAVEAINTTQEILRGLFCQTLKIDRVGIHDDFFALGGHSLKAMQLVTRVSRAFKVSLPIPTFFQSPTPAALAALIDAERGKVRFTAGGAVMPEFLVAIRPGGTRRSLFLLPGGWGGDNEMLVFARLAAYLDHDQPIYAFNARFVQRRGMPSVEAVAREYLAAIRGVCADGAFILAGECIAGSIAFAMACELTTQGHMPPELILLDAHCPRPERLADLPADLWRELPDDVRRYYEALLRWTPGSYAGRIRIVASEASLNDEPLLGWQQGVHGDLSVTAVPGDHRSYIREYVAPTGRALRGILGS
jgi:amino acid adenylation domain-containing protein